MKKDKCTKYLKIFLGKVIKLGEKPFAQNHKFIKWVIVK